MKYMKIVIFSMLCGLMYASQPSSVKLDPEKKKQRIAQTRLLLNPTDDAKALSPKWIQMLKDRKMTINEIKDFYDLKSFARKELPIPIIEFLKENGLDLNTPMDVGQLLGFENLINLSDWKLEVSPFRYLLGGVTEEERKAGKKIVSVEKALGFGAIPYYHPEKLRNLEAQKKYAQEWQHWNTDKNNTFQPGEIVLISSEKYIKKSEPVLMYGMIVIKIPQTNLVSPEISDKWIVQVGPGQFIALNTEEILKNTDEIFQIGDRRSKLFDMTKQESVQSKPQMTTAIHSDEAPPSRSYSPKTANYLFTNAKAKEFYEQNKNASPHQILEISETATQDQIKAAFKNARLKWHPDKFGSTPEDKKDAAEILRFITTAYESIKE